MQFFYLPIAMAAISFLSAIICILVLSLNLSVVTVQSQPTESPSSSSTSYGKDFYIGFIRNTGSRFRFYISTEAEIASFVVESRSGFIQEGNVTFRNPSTVEVSSELEVMESGYTFREKGIHVYTSNNESITIILETFHSVFTYGVFLAYPCLTFDIESDYEYHVISADTTGSPYLSVVLLVGCENNTDISITSSQQVTLPENLQLESSQLVPLKPGDTHEGILHQMQTLLISSNNDLTGTIIRSNKPLTVISGHECASIPISTPGCEPLAVQIPPTITWGRSFLLARFVGRESGSVFKLLATEATSVFVTCNQNTDAYSILKGGFDYHPPSPFCFLSATQPILVAQKAASGARTDGMGDPAIALVSPISQHLNEVSFLSLPSNVFPVSYISVTVEAQYFNHSSILLDGEVLNCTWTAIYNETSFVVPDGYGCSTPITSKLHSPKQHIVSHSNPDGRVSVVINGFSVYNLFEINHLRGYAYLTGQAIFTERFNSTDDHELNTVPFFNVSRYPGIMELERVEESVSQPINIPRGLLFGTNTTTTAYVNENGVISFDKPWKFVYPQSFPTRNPAPRGGKAFAVFWSNNDIRNTGTVRYSTYCTVEGEPSCNINTNTYQPILDIVNEYVQNSIGATDFSGEWMLIAQWDHVPLHPQGDNTLIGSPIKTNTYQAVIVSNRVRTYALYTYICGELQWSSSDGNHPAVVGYYASEEYYENHYLSGYESIRDRISCPQLSRSKRNSDSRKNNTLTFTSGTDARGRLMGMCETIYEHDEMVISEEALMEAEAKAEQCPCTKNQAAQDDARFRPLPDHSNCFVSVRVEQLDFSSQIPIFPTRRCCYNEETGALDRGTLLVQNPLRQQHTYSANNTEEPIFFGDGTFEATCCHDTLQNENENCENFQKRRKQSTNCQSPPKIAIGTGDPHYKPFDFEAQYTHFQGRGYFIILNVGNDTNPDFTLQGRLCSSPPRHNHVTWHSGLAFGDRNNRFEVEGGNHPRFIVKRTSDQNELPNPYTYPTNPPNNAIEIEITRSENRIDAFFFSTGIKLTITVAVPPFNQGQTPQTVFNFNIAVPRSFSGRTFGLLGKMDDDKTNDIAARDGRIYNGSPRTDGAYFDTLMTWQLRQTESLFSRPVDMGCQPNRRKRQTSTISPVFFSQLNFTDSQTEFCEGNPQCLFDLAVSGDMNAANGTLYHEKESNATISILNNSLPVISSDTATLAVNLYAESVLTLTVSDDEDNFTLTVKNLPDHSYLSRLSDGMFEFHWTPQEVITDSLVFVAIDKQGAASHFIPSVEICACTNGGNCSHHGILSSTDTTVLNCLCTEAFDGEFCEEDRNGCSEIQCFDDDTGSKCRDIPAPGVGAVCDPCTTGYTGDGLRCYDIDECLMDGDLCEHTCTNTRGSYTCSCSDGYRVVNERECEDVNECKGPNVCQQGCINTMGSYHCNCNEGFNLANDSHSCNAQEMCADQSACSHGCAVVNGSIQCFCPIGFELDPHNRTQCVDRDECQVEGVCHQQCVNTPGSYMCLCENGYNLSEDGQNCEDIDECLEAALDARNLCESNPNSQCVNNEGSFHCACVPGYILVNRVCQRGDNDTQSMVGTFLSMTIEGNSVNFTTTTLTESEFIPELQQKFRRTTADAVNRYCQMVACVLLDNGDPSTETTETIHLMIEPANIGLPPSLISQDESGRLIFTLFVQIEDKILSQNHLTKAIMDATDLYQKAGFLDHSYTHPPPTGNNERALIIGLTAAFSALIFVLLVIIMFVILCYYIYRRKHKLVIIPGLNSTQNHFANDVGTYATIDDYDKPITIDSFVYEETKCKKIPLDEMQSTHQYDKPHIYQELVLHTKDLTGKYEKTCPHQKYVKATAPCEDKDVGSRSTHHSNAYQELLLNSKDPAHEYKKVCPQKYEYVTAPCEAEDIENRSAHRSNDYQELLIGSKDPAHEYKKVSPQKYENATGSSKEQDIECRSTHHSNDYQELLLDSKDPVNEYKKVYPQKYENPTGSSEEQGECPKRLTDHNEASSMRHVTGPTLR